MDSSQQLCYCFQCQNYVRTPSEEFTCPRCQSGFVETVDSAPSNNEHSFTRSFTQLIQPFLQNQFGFGNNETFFFEDLDEDDSTVNIIREDDDEDEPVNQPRRRRSTYQGPRTRSMTQRLSSQSGSTSSPNNPQARVQLTDPLENIFPNLLSGLNFYTGFDPRSTDHTAFDQIIMMLMSQTESGTPPASDAAIANLPESEINQEELGEHKACSICFEDFNLSVKVVRLPCKHFYHRSCLSRWLRQHATCPICRKDAFKSNSNHSQSRDPDHFDLEFPAL